MRASLISPDNVNVKKYTEVQNKYREFQDDQLAVLPVILRRLLMQSGDNEYLHCLDVLV